MTGDSVVYIGRLPFWILTGSFGFRMAATLLDAKLGIDKVLS